MDTTFSNQTIISYCTGVRGLERGLERAIGPIRTAAYVEIEAFIIENLLAGMEAGLVDAAPIWCNLKTFNAEPFRNRVHGIIGGYPCQPFSFAGNRKGTEDPRHLWPYICQHVSTIRPVWCFFENVRGHLSMGFDEVYRSLSELGYAVECGIFTAEEVGAPHQRERLFILAIRKDWLLGNTQYNGQSAKQELRGNETPSNNGRPEEQNEARESSGTNRPADVPSLSGRKGRIKQDELADTDSIGQSYRESEIDTTEGRFDAFRNTTASSKQKLGYTNSKGLQRGKQHRASNQGERQCKPFDPIGESSCDRWPSSPGQPQYDWEEPRTIIDDKTARFINIYGKKYPSGFSERQIKQAASYDISRTTKSGMGCTIDGYNFREDLLRAYGNGVVEQTAELAFTSLLKKFGL